VRQLFWLLELMFELLEFVYLAVLKIELVVELVFESTGGLGDSDLPEVPGSCIVIL
jgi:hypothetical protein